MHPPFLKSFSFKQKLPIDYHFLKLWTHFDLYIIKCSCMVFLSLQFNGVSFPKNVVKINVWSHKLTFKDGEDSDSFIKTEDTTPNRKILRTRLVLMLSTPTTNWWFIPVQVRYIYLAGVDQLPLAMRLNCFPTDHHVKNKPINEILTKV